MIFRSRFTRLLASVGTIGALLVVALPSAASAQGQDPEWLRSLDELMAVEVSTASRRDRRLSDTSAAAFVLTREDIERSGFVTVPDLLRLVPGVQVAQIDGNKWAVTVRGFNSRWANKLLVMIDGRSVYSSVFSGVYWEALDVPVEMIERIEVVRGPGGSLWGANAMNGVINIITRTAASSGGQFSGAVGTRSLVSGVIQHAGPIGTRVRYQTFFGAADQDTIFRDTNDDSRSIRFGAGMLATASTRDTVGVQLTAVRSGGGGIVPKVISPAPLVLQNSFTEIDTDIYQVSAQWNRALRGDGSLQLSGSLMDLHRAEEIFAVDSNVVELSLQHTAGKKGRHEATWGAAYRRSKDVMVGSSTIAMNPGTFQQTQTGVFVQDDMRLAGDRVVLTAGTKLEWFERTGWHLQPTLRALWHPSIRQTLWTAASTAVRTPSVMERGIGYSVSQIDGLLPIVARLSGNPNLRAESLQSYEAGYRWNAAMLSLDVATFYNIYDDAVNTETGTPYFVAGPGAPHLILPVLFDNKMNVSTAGGEAVLTVAPTPRWRLVGTYNLFVVKADFDAGSQILPGAAFDGDAPRHQAAVRSLLTLPGRVDVDAMMTFVGRLEASAVSPYQRLDARIGWRAQSALDLSVAIRNAFDNRHIEFAAASNAAVFTRSRRQIALQARWRF